MKLGEYMNLRKFTLRTKEACIVADYVDGVPVAACSRSDDSCLRSGDLEMMTTLLKEESENYGIIFTFNAEITAKNQKDDLVLIYFFYHIKPIIFLLKIMDAYEKPAQVRVLFFGDLIDIKELHRLSNFLLLQVKNQNHLVVSLPHQSKNILYFRLHPLVSL